jgi:hypothetical protein
MNTVFILPPRENWIVDRLTKEFNDDNPDIVVEFPNQASIIWLYADWCWAQLPMSLLRSKKVLTTIHHIVPEKFDEAKKREFLARDSITTAYHVPNKRTADFIRGLTKKDIHVIPYWANSRIWKKTQSKEILRQKWNIPVDAYVVGSFQRDTEGSNLIDPKLEKGPDLFLNYICDLEEFKAASQTHVLSLGIDPTPIHVLLAGWRRQYVMKGLQTSPWKTKFTYIELPSQKSLNELYQTLDVYPITSRYEGGPQALIECGLLDVPCVSRPVGMAEEVLPPHSINYDCSRTIPTVPDVSKLLLPSGYNQYLVLLNSL